MVVIWTCFSFYTVFFVFFWKTWFMFLFFVDQRKLDASPYRIIMQSIFVWMITEVYYRSNKWVAKRVISWVGGTRNTLARTLYSGKPSLKPNSHHEIEEVVYFESRLAKTYYVTHDTRLTLMNVLLCSLLFTRCEQSTLTTVVKEVCG